MEGEGQVFAFGYPSRETWFWFPIDVLLIGIQLRLEQDWFLSRFTCPRDHYSLPRSTRLIDRGLSSLFFQSGQGDVWIEWLNANVQPVQYVGKHGSSSSSLSTTIVALRPYIWSSHSHCWVKCSKIWPQTVVGCLFVLENTLRLQQLLASSSSSSSFVNVSWVVHVPCQICNGRFSNGTMVASFPERFSKTLFPPPIPPKLWEKLLWVAGLPIFTDSRPRMDWLTSPLKEIWQLRICFPNNRSMRIYGQT